MALDPRRRSTLTFLQDRIATQLRASKSAGKLTEVPEMLLVIEQLRGRDTHLHGLLNAPSDDLAEIRRCFRLACGEWKVAKQHQTKTVAAPDDGWTSYMLKDRAKVLPFIRKMQIATGSMATTFRGKPYTATQKLRCDTHDAYAADCVVFLGH